MTSERERIEVDCGIACERIRTWLDDELSLERRPAGESDVWVFTAEGGRCVIEIAPLEPRTLGRVAIERTSVAITGDDSTIARFRKLFTLRFVSAGG